MQNCHLKSMQKQATEALQTKPYKQAIEAQATQG